MTATSLEGLAPQERNLTGQPDPETEWGPRCNYQFPEAQELRNRSSKQPRAGEKTFGTVPIFNKRNAEKQIAFAQASKLEEKLLYNNKK